MAKRPKPAPADSLTDLRVQTALHRAFNAWCEDDGRDMVMLTRRLNAAAAVAVRAKQGAA